MRNLMLSSALLSCALGGHALANDETGVTTPDGTKLYVALSGSNEVAVIDVRAREVIGRIGDVGEGPWGAHTVGALNYCH